jgi:glycosyltransferase involved in cell wall biosynthesis
MTPKISVVMSVHNGARFLHDAIDSILNQTFRNFEFIIIDDASSDTSRNIIESYNDARIRLIVNEANTGLTRSLNRGISVARGEFIARMDADDISHSQRLEKQMMFFDKNPLVGVLGSAFKIIDDQGLLQAEILPAQDNGLIKWKLLFFDNHIVHSSACIRKKCLDMVGGYDETMMVSQDYDLWCRLACVTKFHNLKESLLYLRKHPGSITAKRNRTQNELVFRVGQQYTKKLLGLPFDEKGTRTFWKRNFQPETIKDKEHIFGAYYAIFLFGHLKHHTELSYDTKVIIRDLECLILEQISNCKSFHDAVKILLRLALINIQSSFWVSQRILGDLRAKHMKIQLL